MDTKVHTRIKFNGPALEDKSMDVAYLAPSLLALSELVRDINTSVNGDRTGVKIFVNADLEQKCFELNIEFVQTVWIQAKNLLVNENLVAIKEIAEWLDIVPREAWYLGIYGLIRRLRGKKIKSAIEIKSEEGPNNIEIRTETESKPIIVEKPVYNIYLNDSARKKALKVLEPLREEGYESLEFYRNKDEISFSFASEELPSADESDLPGVAPENIHTSRIRVKVRIRKAVYEGDSMWNVVYKRGENVSIEDTEWLERFQKGVESAPPGSWLDVDLEETYPINEDGESIGRSSFKIVKIHGVDLPKTQQGFGFEE